MIRPTRRWYLVAAGLGLLWPLSLLNPAMATLCATLSLLWLLAWGFDAFRAGQAGPQAIRVVRETPPAFSVGHLMPVTWRWENPLSRPLRLDVVEECSPLLDLAAATRTVTLPPNDVLLEHHDVLPVARGKATVGTMHLRVHGPWGLAVREGRQTVTWPIVVYPSLKSSQGAALATPAQRRREAGLRNLRRRGTGRVFESLREWVPGDEVRSIDWKATARRGRTMARQYEDERRQQVMIVIDAGRLLTAETEGRPRLDAAIDAALELAQRAVQRDDDVGLMAFADEVLCYTPPGRGRRALQRVLDGLTGLEGRLVEPDYPAAFAYLAARHRRRAFTVFFTDLIDSMASDAFLSHAGTLRPRHLPLAVTLRDPALERMAMARPDTLDAAYQRAAAEELLDARAGALRHLRRRGVLVLDVPSAGAAQAVVDQYEALKRRAAL